MTDPAPGSRPARTAPAPRRWRTCAGRAAGAARHRCPAASRARRAAMPRPSTSSSSCAAGQPAPRSLPRTDPRRPGTWRPVTPAVAGRRCPVRPRGPGPAARAPASAHRRARYAPAPRSAPPSHRRSSGSSPASTCPPACPWPIAVARKTRQRRVSTCPNPQQRKAPSRLKNPAPSTPRMSTNCGTRAPESAAGPVWGIRPQRAVRCCTPRPAKPAEPRTPTRSPKRSEPAATGRTHRRTARVPAALSLTGPLRQLLDRCLATPPACVID